MDKIKQLQERKNAILKAGVSVREDIATLCDENSFVELAAYSFSKDLFYGEDAQGEGIVTGFATVHGYPFYLIAQNFAVSNGGLSKANCAKIAKTLNAAEKNETPVIYLLHSHGVRIGEGVNVLEGVAELLLKATQLKGTVPQYAVVNGDVFGPSAALVAVCDCIFFTEKSSLCINSPLVLSAKAGKNLKNIEVGGYHALTKAGLPALEAKNLKEVSASIAQITELINVPVVDAELNKPMPVLNKKTDADAILSIFETCAELGALTSPEVKTVLGRIGGISVAAVIFDGAVKLNERNIKKLRSFAEFACCYGFPFVTFVDCVGIEAELAVNDSAVLKEITEYLSILDAIDTAKIAVVTGKAVGLGYSLFAAKSVGFDYTFAFATAQISLFESAVGAEIELADGKADKSKLAAIYADENADPIHAANGGYLDNVIEPQFVKQYLVASLQTLIK